MTPPETIFPTDLFEEGRRAMPLQPGAMLLGGFASPGADALLADLHRVAEVAPFRKMVTPGGWQMSVAMTNCGSLGWMTDRTGYRYDALDPWTGNPWPEMPETFRCLAERAAEVAGYARFDPDSCLMNRYEPGSRLSLHQDRNERDFDAPIVSVSLGLAATFLWGGATRSGKPMRVRLFHGDVVVWGGPARLTFHGVDTLRGSVSLAGEFRYNLTFRAAR
ncbi:DNA oxidative demethylase AlkB [Novosphingobium sp. AP12]|uniref:DNA oxidative demethylase AlkB n=1 Tax=Novosphingobium sp. AP12 TaxID=1144305 RepID=UPI00027200BC|nr:DNA oxidative demethylase AlkB [Novosphingobium sp. AP12]EJL22752.1 alkylated DNA repair protein [Novosphingobium sp. AP12]